MVNARMVNGGSSYFSLATFCEFFRDSGRFLHLQNPFKYTRNFPINSNSIVHALIAQDFIQ